MSCCKQVVSMGKNLCDHVGSCNDTDLWKRWGGFYNQMGVDA